VSSCTAHCTDSKLCVGIGNLGRGNAPPCTPEDDAMAILRRSVDPGLQDAEARLIAVQFVRDDESILSRNFEQVLFWGGE
jgi:hypothetical protein